MTMFADRDEIPARHRWDLTTPITGDDWESAIEDARRLLGELDGVDDPAGDGHRLLQMLERYEYLMQTVEAILTEAKRHHLVDTTDSDADERIQRGRSLATRANTLDDRIRESVRRQGRATIERYVDEVPGMHRYEHYLDDVLRTADRVAADDAGELLSDLEPVLEAPEKIYRTLTTTDLTAISVETEDGDTVTVNNDNFPSLMRHPSRDLRENVYRSLCRRLFDLRSTVATMYRFRLLAERKRALARGYETTRSHALDEKNVPPTTHQILLDEVRENLDPMHRHLELVGERVDGDGLRMWDTFLPVFSTDSPTIPYEEALDHILAAVEPLGSEYRNRLANGIDGNWVDVFPHGWKYPHEQTLMPYVGPPHVLVNYREDVDSLYTLAHELGHAMHAVYVADSQPFVYASPDDIVSEAVGLFHEALLSHHLLESVSSPKLRAAVLDRHLRLFRNTLYRYTMLTAFEQTAIDHLADGGALTVDWLHGQYESLLQEFYPPVELDQFAGDGWMRKPHSHSLYITYQYCIGFVAGISLASDVASGEPEAPDRFEQLLRAGSSDYPFELLIEAGVDSTLAESIETAVSRYDDSLDHVDTVARTLE